MKITLFAKSMTNKDGKPFNKYLTKIKKCGEEITVQVKFKMSSDTPKTFPVNLEFDKSCASYSESTKSITNEDGSVTSVIQRVLWLDLNSEEYTETPYVDTSMDDIE